MDRLLESLQENAGNTLGESVAHEDKDSNRMRDPIVASLCIVHSNCCGFALLEKKIGQEAFAKASHVSRVAFSAPMLVIGDRVGTFGVSKDTFANHLVVNLKLRGHA